MTDTGLHYAVDIVMCVDATGSMHHTLAGVRDSVLSFHQLLTDAMAAKGRGISQLRLKLIAFRDFGDRADDAIEESRFFTIPQELKRFEAVVAGLDARGGGDEPESALAALALAVAADWETGLDRRRHVIVLFTDASAHPLGAPGQTAAYTYPLNIPATMDGLFAQWGHARSQSALMENSAKRLLLFAPEASPWEEIAEDWNNTLYFPSVAGEGLEEWEMSEIIDTIANSL